MGILRPTTNQVRFKPPRGGSSLEPTAGPPPATNGETYNYQLPTGSNAAPVAWSVASGSLPPGVTLSDGAISGTPSAPGSYTVTLAGDQDVVLSFEVEPRTPVITAPSLSVLTEDDAVSESFTATDGIAPYAWTVLSGALPTGLTLASDGALTGTATSPGSFSAVIQVEGADGGTRTTSLTVTVEPIPLSIATTTVASATGDQAYSAVLSVTGGISPYTWDVASGVLPTGVTLSTDGTLSGTPTQSGAFNFVARVTDTQPVTDTQALTLTVDIVPLAITADLANPQLDEPYSVQLAATGGIGDKTFAVTAGNLPTGLTLSSAGLLAGTPTVDAEVSTFTVTATDADSNTVTREFTLTVIAAGAPVAIGSAMRAPLNTQDGLSITAGPDLDADTALSANIWVYAETVTNNETFVGRGANVAGEGGWSLGTHWSRSDGSLWAEYAVSGTDMGNSSYATWDIPDLLTAGAWQMFTLVWDLSLTGNDRVKLYKNGVFVPLTSLVGTPPADFSTMNNGDIEVGSPVGFYRNTNNNTTRLFREFSYYQRALTEPEIGLLYRAGAAGTPPNPDLYVPFAPNDATDIVDGVATVLTGTATMVDAAGTGAPFEPIEITSNLTGLPLNEPFTAQLTATGGAGPYTWAVTTGSLPTGLTLASDGTLSGTPTVEESSTFTVTVTDSEDNTVTREYTLAVTAIVGVWADAVEFFDASDLAGNTITQWTGSNRGDTLAWDGTPMNVDSDGFVDFQLNNTISVEEQSGSTDLYRFMHEGASGFLVKWRRPAGAVDPDQIVGTWLSTSPGNAGRPGTGAFRAFQNGSSYVAAGWLNADNTANRSADSANNTNNGAGIPEDDVEQIMGGNLDSSGNTIGVFDGAWIDKDTRGMSLSAGETITPLTLGLENATNRNIVDRIQIARMLFVDREITPQDVADFEGGPNTPRSTVYDDAVDYWDADAIAGGESSWAGEKGQMTWTVTGSLTKLGDLVNSDTLYAQMSLAEADNFSFLHQPQSLGQGGAFMVQTHQLLTNATMFYSSSASPRILIDRDAERTTVTNSTNALGGRVSALGNLRDFLILVKSTQDYPSALVFEVVGVASNQTRLRTYAGTALIGEALMDNANLAATGITASPGLRLDRFAFRRMLLVKRPITKQDILQFAAGVPPA